MLFYINKYITFIYMKYTQISHLVTRLCYVTIMVFFIYVTYKHFEREPFYIGYTDLTAYDPTAVSSTVFDRSIFGQSEQAGQFGITGQSGILKSDGSSAKKAKTVGQAGQAGQAGQTGQTGLVHTNVIHINTDKVLIKDKDMAKQISEIMLDIQKKLTLKISDDTPDVQKQTTEVPSWAKETSYNKVLSY